jgi:hypothetical protein
VDASPAGFGPYIGRSFPLVHPGESPPCTSILPLFEPVAWVFGLALSFSSAGSSHAPSTRGSDRPVAARQRDNERSELLAFDRCVGRKIERGSGVALAARRLAVLTAFLKNIE